MIDKDFWTGKRVFLTGHTGFKGSWAALWLNHMGAIVHGYSLAPSTQPSLFEITRVDSLIESQFADIRDRDCLVSSFEAFKPDIVLHMAAQPLVRYSYREPVETFETNAMGTMNVLEATRQCPSITAVLVVTTDKCYDNKEWHWGYRESEPLGGLDPYSASKACAELITHAYRHSFFGTSSSTAIATARAGNVIGGGDWSENRLVPDILNSLVAGDAVSIRNPESIRPWQHVVEPIAGYLLLLERLASVGQEYAEAWNFGPPDGNAKNVQWIVETMAELWGSQTGWEVSDGHHPHEANYLKLDSSKANTLLNWKGKWGLENALRATVEWHKAWVSGSDMHEHCLKQIDDYLNDG